MTTPPANIYDRLLQLPLFLGMSRADINRAVGHARLDFFSVQDGTTVASEGEPCGHLLFLMQGSLLSETFSDDRGYSFQEDIPAPAVLQPERLFGLTPRYSSTFTAMGECRVLSLDKHDAMRMLAESEVFRLNVLNLLSNGVQKLWHLHWRSAPQTLRMRIVRFFLSHCTRPAGRKQFHIKMVRLAEEMNDSRLDISRELNRMEAEQLVVLRRAVLEIPAIERLL